MRFPIRSLVVSTLLIGTGLTTRAEIRNVVVTSGASFEPGLPPRGSIAAVFCTGLEDIDGVVSAATQPLPTELAGVRVRVGGAAAPLFAVASVGAYQQINFQVPWEAVFNDLEQNAEVVVEQKGNQATVQPLLRLATRRQWIGQGTPGDFFRLPGTNYGVFQHAADYALVTPENPASAGETIIAYLSGMPGTTPGVPTGQPAPFQPLAIVPRGAFPQGTFDDYWLLIAKPPVDANPVPQKSAEILFIGLSPGSVGVYQINFVLPKPLDPGLKTVTLERTFCILCPSFTVDSRSSPVLIPVR